MMKGLQAIHVRGAEYSMKGELVVLDGCTMAVKYLGLVLSHRSWTKAKGHSGEVGCMS